MSDWAVGDLAACVASGRVTQRGAIYTVSDVCFPGEPHPGLFGIVPWCGLRFRGMKWPKGVWADASRFRRIRPDKHEKCEPEFVELLKRSKVNA